MSERTGILFSSAFRNRTRFLAGAGLILASTVPFGVGLLVVNYLLPDPRGVAAAVVAGACLALSLLLTAWAQNRLALVGNGWLRRQMRLQREECRRQTGEASPTFVGFAPGDMVFTWEGDTDLDVGYLCIVNDTLVCFGDQFEWSLHKELIDQIEMTPPLNSRRVIVRWHEPREAGRAFTLSVREGPSLKAADAQTLALYERLSAWLAKPAEDSERDFTLGAPPTSLYGGLRWDQPVAGWCATTLALGAMGIVTLWYVVNRMFEQQLYWHAVLWAGLISIGGAVVTRVILHYLQSTSSRPAPNKSPTRP